MSSCDCQSELLEWKTAEGEYHKAESEYYYACAEFDSQQLVVDELEALLAFLTSCLVLNALWASCAIASTTFNWYLAKTKLDQLETIKNAKEEGMEVKEGKAKDEEEEYNSCLQNMHMCGKCAVEFKTDCIHVCGGCGSCFCSNCFDSSIEEYELAE